MDRDLTFYAGAVSVDITPALPVALVGQYYKRLAREVFSPLQANILAVEQGGVPVVFVACDWLGVPEQFVAEARELLRQWEPEFPEDHVIFSAIHTHTGPYVYKDHGSMTWGKEFDWERQDPEETSPEAYKNDVLPKIVQGILDAWRSREPARLSTGMDHASISFCRRTVYADGSAVMYGNTNRPDFLRMESSGDDGLHFAAIERSSDGALMAAMIEVACPSQVLEHHDYVASDFWHNVRCRLKETYGQQAVILGLCGAAGDLSPRDLIRMAMPEPEMHDKPLYQPEGAQAIGQELCERFEGFMTRRTPLEAPRVAWTGRQLELPLRMVTEEAKNEAEVAWQKCRAVHEEMRDFTEPEAYAMSIEAGVVIRWKQQQTQLTAKSEVQVVQLGDMTIATNPFELFVEYADRIRSRSGGGNFMIIQLAGGYQGYLPTAPAMQHGGYSALVCNGLYGSAGGDKLVEETLEMVQDVRRMTAE